MNSILQIPEIAALRHSDRLLRIPPETDVPLTARVRRLIDSSVFQRLSRISQLGLVQLVYPGATHTRFEHSLGVYLNCLQVIQQLARHDRFCEQVSQQDATCLILAALLHDVGHWPFCHAIEDLSLECTVAHEVFAQQYLQSDEMVSLLRQDWSIEPQQVAELLLPRQADATPTMRLLRSILSGPIDIDKIDYLYRDSLHSGVPYGLNFDKRRLISSLCLNEAGDGLAVLQKGRTAAELLVFCRYVMFNEVYWHHAVRSGTAMLQRAFYEIQCRHDVTEFFVLNDNHWRGRAFHCATGYPEEKLLDGIFGFQRRLHKRIAEYDSIDVLEVYAEIARRPYPWLVECSNRFGEILGKRIGSEIGPCDILIDAPPVGLEVQFDVDLFDPTTKRYRNLGEVSPVTKALATSQFDDFVKRVRVFATAEHAEKVTDDIDLTEVLYQAASF